MQRVLALALRAAAACLPVAFASPALAGGGAHVVDDDATLPPGTCHVETWVTAVGSGDGLVNANPACTFPVLPRLEIAAGVQRSWGSDSSTRLAPALKLNLRSFEEAPFGIALSGTAIINLDTGRTETVAVNMPISMRATDRLVLHANVGWVHQAKGEDRNALTWGGQAEYQMVPNLWLMGEVFGRDRGQPGAQGGLRWVTDRGRIDIDLLAGHRIDGTARNAVTLGITVRR